MGEAQVKLWRVSTVAPAIPTAKHRMYLSNLDLFWLHVDNVQTLLFYTTPTDVLPTVVERLKSSLSSALVHFYPLAGRLATGSDEHNRSEIDCNDAGVHFIEASIDIPFQDLEADDFQHRSFFSKLVHRHDNDFTTGDSPLLSIQVTGFLGGGICIGSTMHHVVADGKSFWHFMKSWAEISRGLPISMLPEHNRKIFKLDKIRNKRISFKAEPVIHDNPALKDRNEIFKLTPDPQMPSAEHQKSLQECKSDMESDNTEIARVQHDKQVSKDELIYRTFHLSQKMIQNLKERVGPNFSSFVAVAAHFWRCVMKTRCIAAKEFVYFRLLADCRSRVKPALPQTYFGNCVHFSLGRTSAKHLLNEHISFAAGLIQEIINSCTSEEQMKNMIDWLEPPSTGLKRFRREFVGHCLTNVVSSPRFPVYEMDFGWGRPLNVQAGSINEIGAMVLFPGRDGGGSIDITTCLPNHQMQTFQTLFNSTFDDLNATLDNIFSGNSGCRDRLSNL
eukprot:Gb_01766 [translate_table: standard]